MTELAAGAVGVLAVALTSPSTSSKQIPPSSSYDELHKLGAHSPSGTHSPSGSLCASGSPGPGGSPRPIGSPRPSEVDMQHAPPNNDPVADEHQSNRTGATQGQSNSTGATQGQSNSRGATQGQSNSTGAIQGVLGSRSIAPLSQSGHHPDDEVEELMQDTWSRDQILQPSITVSEKNVVKSRESLSSSIRSKNRYLRETKQLNVYSDTETRVKKEKFKKKKRKIVSSKLTEQCFNRDRSKFVETSFPDKSKYASSPSAGDVSDDSNDYEISSVNSAGSVESDDDLSDGEVFNGKIVYNVDGSAYIIEGGQSDTSESLSNFTRQEGAIVDFGDRVFSSSSAGPSYPEIARAVYIRHLPSRPFENQFPYPTTSDGALKSTVTPISHSYLVYNVRSNRLRKVEDSLQDVRTVEPSMLGHLSKASSTPLCKPILMCFICKLSFSYTRSFTAHASVVHKMRLNDRERAIVTSQNVSALIQCIGSDNSPLMSFLEQVPTVVTESCREEVTRLPPPYPSAFPRKVSVVQTSSVARPSDTTVSYVYSQPPKPIVIVPMETEVYNDVAALRLSEFHQRVRPEENTRVGLLPLNIKLEPTRDTNTVLDKRLDLYPSESKVVDEYDELPYRPTSQPKQSITNWTNGFSNSLCAKGAVNASLEKNNNSISDVDGVDSDASCHFSSGVRLSGSKVLSANKLSSRSSTPLSYSTAPLNISNGNTYQTSSSTSFALNAMSSQLNGCEDHPNAFNIDCTTCDSLIVRPRSPLTNQAMNAAAAALHTRNSCKTLKCPKCNWHYKYQETLEIHMKEKHPDSEMECPYCINGQPHPRLARGESYTCGYKPYRCDICNYSTTTKGNLSIHLQSDKHTNNMQDLQIGVPPSNTSVDIKMPMTPPVVVGAGCSSGSASNSNAGAASRKLKSRATYRCEFCSYETTESRNLRIHMTSEKHAHNLHTLQQNMNMNDMQMNPLAMFGQDPRAMLSMPPLMGMYPSSIDPSMFMPSFHTNMASVSRDSPIDFTKPQSSSIMTSQPAQLKSSTASASSFNREKRKVEQYGIFKCNICEIFSSDTLESLQNHIQHDRSKNGMTDQEMVTILAGGMYLCNLCQYKSALKANFQLHCKTDKHLQRIQLVNHIQEGVGSMVDLNQKLLSAATSPVQVSCGSCDYHTNSVYRLQMHATTSSHEANSRLYHHLSGAESRLGRGSSKSVKCYGCCICNYWSKTKLGLIEHSESVRHIQREELLLPKLREQGLDKVDAIFVVEERSLNNVQGIYNLRVLYLMFVCF